MEQDIKEGENPVTVSIRVSPWYPEYSASEIALEVGRHKLPTLNTPRDR